MAKSIKKDSSPSEQAKQTSENKAENASENKKSWKINRQHKLFIGSTFILFSIALLVAFISFFIYGHEDQSTLQLLAERGEKSKNWLGKFGAIIADFFIYKGFGAASFLFVKLFFLTGSFLALDIPLKKLKNIWFWDLFAIVLISILFGFFANTLPELGGTIGYEMNLFSQDYIGRIGTLLVLILGITIYLIFKIKISPDTVKAFFERNKKEISDDLASVKMPMSDSSYNLEEFAVKEEEDAEEDLEEEPELKTPSQFEINKETLKPTIANPSEIHLEPIVKTAPLVTPPTPQIIATNDESFVIEKAPEEATIEENLASRLVADFGLFDPTLELSNYKFPTLDLLKEYSGGGITINQAEL
jgi:S-DNA-T family DNA segregation ATPase FtsK/SpoIIIE